MPGNDTANKRGRIEFVQCKDRDTAKRKCPWAVVTAKVDNGYKAYERMNDYKLDSQRERLRKEELGLLRKRGRKHDYRKPNPLKVSKAVRLTESELAGITKAREVTGEKESDFIRNAVDTRVKLTLKKAGIPLESVMGGGTSGNG